jgi:tellurite resistance protein TerC
MTDTLLFPLSHYWWFYLGFTGFVSLLLLIDLGVFHRRAHVVTSKESALWSAVWFGLALAFGVGLYFYAVKTFPKDPRLIGLADFDPNAAAQQIFLEFLTGFIIEKSLAIDNIFVFVVVFSYFAIPPISQHRVLFFGIIGALIFRAIFIALGAALLQYQWIVVIAGIFLILTGVKILIAPEKMPDPGHNPLINLVKRFFAVTNEFHGQKFFVRTQGIVYATPLFLALVFIEFSDIIFAIDSVPAIFAITKEPLIVYTSNIFAILGLRSLYFLLANVVGKFRFLKYGLGLILVFVGLKMAWLNEVFDGKFPVTWSLGIICAIFSGAAVLSIIIKPKMSIKNVYGVRPPGSEVERD